MNYDKIYMKCLELNLHRGCLSTHTLSKVSFLRISENETFESVILESVKIESVRVDRHLHKECLLYRRVVYADFSILK